MSDTTAREPAGRRARTCPSHGDYRNVNGCPDCALAVPEFTGPPALDVSLAAARLAVELSTNPRRGTVRVDHVADILGELDRLRAAQAAVGAALQHRVNLARAERDRQCRDLKFVLDSPDADSTMRAAGRIEAQRAAARHNEAHACLAEFDRAAQS